MLDSSDLEVLLSKARKSAKTMSKVTREIAQGIETINVINFNATLPLYYLDNTLYNSEFCLRNYNIADLSSIEELFSDLGSFVDYEPYELLPMPEVLSVDDHTLLTPFPFIVEAPTLNVSLSFCETLNKIIENSSSMNENLHKVR